MERNEWYGHSGLVAGEQPLRRDKTYIDPKIYDYCLKSGIDVVSYCKSIEPSINPSSTLILYNSRNPNHVSDVISEGCVLVGGGILQTDAMSSLQSFAQKNRETLGEHGQSVNLRELLPDTNKQKQIDVLKSFGIGYEKIDVGRPVQQQSPKQNDFFSKLVEELNK
jgi:hypothetical protein